MTASTLTLDPAPPVAAPEPVPPPAAGAVSCHRVPSWDPPYDDEPPRAVQHRARPDTHPAPWVQRALALPLPGGSPGRDRTGPDRTRPRSEVRPPLHLVPDIPLDVTPYDEDGAEVDDEPTGEAFEDEEFDEPAPAFTYPLPAVHRAWMGRLGQALVEVLAGDRPPQQLLPWTSAVVYSTARYRAIAASRARPNVDLTPRPPAHLRSVQVSQPRADVAEVCALVRHGERTRAIAFRLEAWRGRWRCTAYELA